VVSGTEEPVLLSRAGIVNTDVSTASVPGNLLWNVRPRHWGPRVLNASRRNYVVSKLIVVRLTAVVRETGCPFPGLMAELVGGNSTTTR